MMMGRTHWCFVGWVAACLLGCASSWGDAPLETAEAEGRVVVTLHARDTELTLMSTAGGVRYAVRDERSGLQPWLTLDQLLALHPQLFELVKSATARSGGAVLGNSSEDRDGAGVDASLFGVSSESASEDAPLDTRRGAGYGRAARSPARYSPGVSSRHWSGR